MDHLLVVDDDDGIRRLYVSVAEDMGYETSEAACYEDCLGCYEKTTPTAILLDLTMPGGDGIEMLRALADLQCDAPIILISGQDRRVIATAERLGKSLGLLMRPPLQKPISIDVLETTLQQIRRGQWTAVQPQKVIHFLPPSWLTADDLQRAIRESELLLHYQPKIDLQSPHGPAIAGAEALVRWQHPEHGLVPPGDFILLAEAEGLIGDLTESVLSMAIKQQQAWITSGLKCPLAFNLSPLQLTDLELPDRINSMLDASGIDPSLLVVEVTEQSAMADIAKATDILTRLRLKGISVSLDDFGSGYSSLAELYRLPLSELKFDRSLIADLDVDRDARTVVRALIALAQSLEIPVCAEGIETKAQVRFLRGLGCERGQGFVFERPVVAESFFGYVQRLEHETASGNLTWDKWLIEGGSN